MCTSQVVLMDTDRGILARIDRKILAGLWDDEALRTLRVPATAAKWATWKRYCDSVGISMGRAVTMLIDRELISVLGDTTGNELPVFAQRASDQLAVREARIVVREREVDTREVRMRVWSEGVRRREDELKVRELHAETASTLESRRTTARTKIGRNECCPCGSGRKHKHCHGLPGRRA